MAAAVAASVAELLGCGATGVATAVSDARSHVVVQSCDEYAPLALAAGGAGEAEDVRGPVLGARVGRDGGGRVAVRVEFLLQVLLLLAAAGSRRDPGLSVYVVALLLDVGVLLAVYDAGIGLVRAFAVGRVK